MSQVIDLSVFHVAAPGQAIPEKLPLSHCLLPMRHPIPTPGLFSGLYGQGKLTAISDSIMSARQAGSQIAVVDIRVELPRPIIKTRRTRLEDFDETGLVSVLHTTRESIDDLARKFRKHLSKRGVSRSAINQIDWSSPAEFMEQSDIVGIVLTENKPWDQLSALVYPAYIATSPTTTMVATVKLSDVKLLDAKPRFTRGCEVQIDI